MTTPDTSTEVERFSAEYVRFLAGLDGPTCQPTEDDERLSHEIGEVPVMAAEIVELRARVLRLRRECNEAHDEIDRLRALLPSPAAVRQARLVAAEIVDAGLHDAYDEIDPADGAHQTANELADHIRDRADTHSGTRDEGGDVDGRELLWCAQRVDRCMTLGELEALVAQWREVANG